MIIIWKTGFSQKKDSDLQKTSQLAFFVKHLRWAVLFQKAAIRKAPGREARRWTQRRNHFLIHNTLNPGRFWEGKREGGSRCAPNPQSQTAWEGSGRQAYMYVWRQARSRAVMMWHHARASVCSVHTPDACGMPGENKSKG